MVQVVVILPFDCSKFGLSDTLVSLPPLLSSLTVLPAVVRFPKFYQSSQHHTTIILGQLNKSKIMAVYETDPHKNTFKDGGGYTSALVGIQLVGISPQHDLISISSNQFAWLYFESQWRDS